MRRRDVITGVCAAAAWPAAVRAQGRTMPVIGFLNSGSAADWAPRLAAFRQGLGDEGYAEGKNVEIAYRWAEYDYDRLPGLAAELVRQNVDVFVATGGDKSIEAARTATQTIPIVFTTGGDPVRSGYVESLSRPAGNATGASFLGIALEAKRLQVLHETVPQAASIAVLLGPANTRAALERRDIALAAEALNLQVRFLTIRTDRDLDGAFAALIREGVQAIQVVSDPFFDARCAVLSRLTARERIPTIYAQRDFPATGGLMSYGASFLDGYLKAGMYAGKILKGARPADLPVQQSTKVELVINLKTAKALGITVPLSLLGRADEVIE
jgi:ABC-type uncharacterized transport system substrate-binding protein